MDYIPEFPLPTRKEEEAIIDYFNKEQQFMATENFYENPRNRQIRSNAIHAIATGSWGKNFDLFIPYLAMNCFDRFVSRYSVCLTISFKMRRKAFDAIAFMKRRGVETTLLKIMVTELQILNGLEWRMRSITPLCFLDYYYPAFRKLGGFRRNCINEIIVQSQAVYRFTQFKPSDIAFSSLMAAASILYPNQYQNILNEESAHISEEGTECMNLMIEFCNIMDFSIEPAMSEVDAGRSAPPAEPTPAEIPTKSEEARNKGKGIMESSSEISTQTEEARNKGKGIMESLSEIPTESEDVRSKGKGIMESLSEIPAPMEEARNKGKGITQRSSESGSTGTPTVWSSGTFEETAMDVVELRTTLARGKEISLAPGEDTTSEADELTNKLMTFKLRWKEITRKNLTIGPLPLVEVEANGSVDETENASAVWYACNCNLLQGTPLDSCCNIL